MKRLFSERLGRERLYWDGGTGSVLQARGLRGGELPERWNLTRPEEIRALAEAYYLAGSDIVNSNTFGANRLHYPDRKELREIVQRGVCLAAEGRRLAGRKDAFVALDVGPTGRLLSPMGDLDFEEAVEIFAEVMHWGEEAGAELILIETMSDSLEAKAAVLAAKEHTALPVCVTMVYDEKGKLLTGGTVQSVTAMLEGLRVDALGVNCGFGPRKFVPLVRELMEISSLPVIASPNAGLPGVREGQIVYDLGAEEFAEEMCAIAELGVQVLGGCCGTTPEYIRREIEKTRGIPFRRPEPKHRSVISSFSRVVEIGNRPVIIGERINPTGKQELKDALRSGQLEYLLEQGISQEEAGAEVLDVNVGLPDIDEPALLERVVVSLQSVTALPLQLDTTNPAALERGLRCYNGKALINSVNGKQESMDAVFPLAAKYGGVVVALALDEGGIPETAEGRIAVARKIYREAKRYGIAAEDIVVDGLAMTISTDGTAAQTTLETVRRVCDELGGHSILGVSNISFGLPQRDMLNAFFFAMALQSGLSLAIVNPNSEAMMAAFHAHLALSGADAQCAEYVRRYASAPALFQGGEPGQCVSRVRGAEKGQTEEAEEGAEEGAGVVSTALGESIRNGMKRRAAEAAETAIQSGADPLELVNRELIPALDAVGRGFERGDIFLPQLLMSAEAAKAAFQLVKEALRGTERPSKGKIILATVKGDIHDIGKNIVKVLLENYGYEVLDLGKDVRPDLVAETTVREQVKLVGLSALMTTTVVGMEETIALLREQSPETKIVVGGAVMTQRYAERIGADCYAREAMDTVRYADQILGKESFDGGL